ncbi:MAG: hypothetical protein HFE87_04525 [Acutalibacter sp.]|nr:hypothetical protein [Acutalibacter sp.]
MAFSPFISPAEIIVARDGEYLFHKNRHDITRIGKESAGFPAGRKKA